MSDEPQKKPDPIEDVRKGLGLLLRAATTAVNALPTDKFETAVVSGVKEVGRAIENVAQAIDKEVFKNGHKPAAPVPPATSATSSPSPTTGSPTTNPPNGDNVKDDEKVWATQQPIPGDVPAPDVPEKPDTPEPPVTPPGEPTNK
jgi:hypothetical protein